VSGPGGAAFPEALLRRYAGRRAAFQGVDDARQRTRGSHDPSTFNSDALISYEQFANGLLTRPDGWNGLERLGFCRETGWARLHNTASLPSRGANPRLSGAGAVVQGKIVKAKRVGTLFAGFAGLALSTSAALGEEPEHASFLQFVDCAAFAIQGSHAEAYSGLINDAVALALAEAEREVENPDIGPTDPLQESGAEVMAGFRVGTRFRQIQTFVLQESVDETTPQLSAEERWIQRRGFADAWYEQQDCAALVGELEN
jgi:hypothetical protein